MLLDEMRVAGAPTRALAPLLDVKEEALSEEAFYFNDPAHYQSVSAALCGGSNPPSTKSLAALVC